jgi:hypothetical protein
MGDNNGMGSALAFSGTNEVLSFDGGYFSFAFGDEIALAINGSFYILNCDRKLFDELQEKVDLNTSKEDAIKLWKEKAKEYEANAWSEPFSDLD